MDGSGTASGGEVPAGSVRVVRGPDAVRVVRDTRPDEGPLRGLAAGLDASEHALAIVVGGAMWMFRWPNGSPERKRAGPKG